MQMPREYGDGVTKAGAAQESAEVVPFPEAPVVGIAFAVGLQFHPWVALVKHLDGAENRADYDTAQAFFRAIGEALPALSKAA